MFSKVNQTPVNPCALRAVEKGCALAQKAHHGRRGVEPFRAIYVAENQMTKPATLEGWNNSL
jgi:hypothetical protein